MISYEIYKWIHILGLSLLFFGLAVVLVLGVTGQWKSKARVLGFITHGLGLFLMLVSGFGMAARLGMVSQLPDWVYAKLGIWLLLGLAISVLKRKPQWAYLNFIAIFVLGGSAMWLAIMKQLPF